MTPSEMSLEKLLLILRMRARFIIGAFTVSIVIAGIITYVTPKMYTATASLNFDLSGHPVDAQGSAILSENSYISTQKGIIESKRVAKKVEDSLTEYERDRLIKAFESKRSIITELTSLIKSPVRLIFSDNKKRVYVSNNSEKLQISSAYSWLAGAIASGLFVQPMFNSRIVQVSYSSTDRKIAALMANRYADAYIATNLEMIVDPARKSEVWFNEQLKSLLSRLEAAQSSLTEYQQAEGIVSSDERLGTETSRLQDLSSQLVAAQEATRNAVTARQKLKDVLGRGDSLTTFAPVFNNSVVMNIKAEIRDLQGQLVENSNTLGNNHPKMKKLNSELSAAQKRLQSEIQAITDGISNAAELSRERERDLEKALEVQKILVLDLKNEHDRITVLGREVESAQATYNAALKQLNTSNMQSMVDRTNVSVVDRANIPTRQSSPKVMANLALGALGGLLLGIGLAVFMEMFTRRVYSREDLTLELGVPLLGHLKKL